MSVALSELLFDYKVVGACVTHISTPTLKCSPGGQGIPGVSNGGNAYQSCPSSDNWQNYQDGWRIIGGQVTQTTVTNERGNQFAQRFNEARLGTEFTNAQGQKRTVKRDPTTQRITQSTDSLGSSTRYEYNGLGQVLRMVDPLGRITDTSYNSQWNKPATVTRYLDDGTPVTTVNQYDSQTGHVIRNTDPLGNVTIYTYTTATSNPTNGPSGQFEIITNPLGHVTRFAYNAQGDLTRVTDALGNATSLQPDAAGQATQSTNPLSQSTQQAYNGIGQPTTTTDAIGGNTTLAYNPSQSLESVKNPLDNTIERYRYDALKRLTTKTDATGADETYRYDKAGNLIEMTDRKGQRTSYSYDEQDRLTQTLYPDGQSQRRGYDSIGRLDIAEEARGNAQTVISYSYDEVNRVTQVATRTVADGKTLNYTLVYRYDSLDRVTKRTLSFNNQTEPTDYQYDKAGRLTEIKFRNQTTTYVYDQASRLTSIAYKKNGASQTLIEQIAYAYDAAGRRTSRTTTNDHSHVETPIEATYDAANRMQTLTLKPGTAEEARFTLSYDANGNLTTKTQIFPPTASATASNPNKTTTYTWDSRNRLTALSVRPEPVEGSSGITASFRYDAQGRRIARTVTQAAGTANAIANTTHYIYEGQQSLGELNANTNNADQFEPLITGLQLDEVIARYTQNGTITYLIDALNTVMTQTNQTQDALTQYGYSPYGESTVKSGDNNALNSTNSNTYTAREDDQTGLVFYRARLFDPVLKRFISEDPIGMAGGTNMYAYVNNSPLNFSDPSGNDPWAKDPGQTWYCTAPLHKASWADFGGYGPGHHGFLCTSQGDCGGQDMGPNPSDAFGGAGQPSKGDKFNPARCEPLPHKDKKCFENCIYRFIYGPRPPYNVIPSWRGSKYSQSDAPMCQEWAWQKVRVCTTECN